MDPNIGGLIGVILGALIVIPSVAAITVASDVYTNKKYLRSSLICAVSNIVITILGVALNNLSYIMGALVINLTAVILMFVYMFLVSENYL